MLWIEEQRKVVPGGIFACREPEGAAGGMTDSAKGCISGDAVLGVSLITALINNLGI